MTALASVTFNFADLQDITPLYAFLNAKPAATVTLTSCQLSRAQESLHNTLRTQYGARYTTSNITWR